MSESIARDLCQDYLQGSIITMEQVGLAERVLDHIQKNPDRWEQGTWMDREAEAGATQTLDNCGTTACFAGWVALLDGHELHLTLYGTVNVDGLKSISDWAAERLGLPEYTGTPEHIFNGSNDLETLEDWVDAMRLRAEQLEVAADMRKPVAVIQ